MKIRDSDLTTLSVWTLDHWRKLGPRRYVMCPVAMTCHHHPCHRLGFIHSQFKLESAGVGAEGNNRSRAEKVDDGERKNEGGKFRQLHGKFTVDINRIEPCRGMTGPQEQGSAIPKAIESCNRKELLVSCMKKSPCRKYMSDRATPPSFLTSRQPVQTIQSTTSSSSPVLNTHLRTSRVR